MNPAMRNPGENVGEFGLLLPAANKARGTADPPIKR